MWVCNSFCLTVTVVLRYADNMVMLNRYNKPQDTLLQARQPERQSQSYVLSSLTTFTHLYAKILYLYSNTWTEHTRNEEMSMIDTPRDLNLPKNEFLIYV